MKFEWDKKYFSVSVYAFGVLATAILFYFGAQKFIENLVWGTTLVYSVLKPIFYGLLLAYIINPIVKTLEELLSNFFRSGAAKKLKAKNLPPKLIRGISISLAWLTILALAAFMISVLIPCVNANLIKISNNSETYLENINRAISKLEKVLHYPSGSLVGQINQATHSLELVTAEALQQILPHILSITRHITTGLVNAFVAIIVSIYFLFSKELFYAQTKKTMSAFMKQETIEKMFACGHEVDSAFNGFLFGKFIDSLLVGIICYVGMLIFRIPYAALIGLIVGITNVIPYFGPFIGAVPCCVILLLESPVKALIFTAFILVLQQFDGNVLGPKVLKETTGLSGFWVIFSIILFGGLFGVVGMFFGVPIFAAFYVFFKRVVEERLASKKMPTKTQAYAKAPEMLILDADAGEKLKKGER